MTSVGETLRRERLRTGLDLHKVAENTKISVRMLELIEADQFDKLPGGVFARSFVGQYARALGLDVDEVLSEFRKTVEPDEGPTPPASPAEESSPQPNIRVARMPQWSGRMTPGSSSFSALAGVVLVVLLCSVAYTWWQRPHSEPVPSPPSMAPAVKAPENAVTAPPAVAPAPESPASFAPPVVTAPAAAVGSSVRIALTAEEETWISATSNGKSVYVGTLQPKETKEIAAADSIKLVIGNAGGLEITLNGKSIPPVGPKGQVRVVQLTREGVQVIPRTSPPAQPL